jgi:hypothetical protein
VNTNLVGRIFPAPLTVVSTGFVKVVGANTDSGRVKWEFLAVEYDPINKDAFRTAFEVKAEELRKWGGA